MKKICHIIAVIFLVSIGSSYTWATVKISGTILNTQSKDVNLLLLVGQSAPIIATSSLNKDGSFEINSDLAQSDYFFLQIAEGNIYLILHEQSDVKVYADAKDLTQFTNIVGSDESASFNNFIGVASVWNKQKQEAIQRMQTNPEIAESVNAQMQPLFQEFQGAFQEFMQMNQNSPALLAALEVLNPENEFTTFEQVVNSLKNIFGQSVKVQEVYAYYKQLKEQKDSGNMFAPGKPAPDFEELMVDRKTKMKLSDLRGKVVLLDFWASWCGPCRRENPNVVATYKKYKDKGFTVMSVSLDNNLDNWKNAIDKDQLEWPNHVSDLKQWSSAVGRMYQVTGIPFTVLIDKEGNIVSTNLRGAQLEEEVARLLQ